jgi:Transposase DDE domain
MKKKTHEILEKIRLVILSENFKMTYRSNEEDFIRSCIITFPILILLILNFMRRSLQVELNNFGKFMYLPSISKQAFSAARKKLLPTAFIELNKILTGEFYSDNEFKTFLGYRLIVVDGSTLQLPEGDSIKEKYGTCSNQKEGMSMARISHAYDPLNGIILSAIMRPYKSCERAMAFDHILEIPPSNDVEDLYLFDRGYPFITLIFFLLFHKKNFVMRCSTAWLDVVNQVLKSGKRDVIIEVNPRMIFGEKRKDFQKRLPNVCLKSFIKIRVLIIDLCTGEKEILITSLLDKNIFEYKIFKDLYHLRWGGEESYKFHKVRVEVENFSGKTPHAIEQDFHATVFTGNVRALLAEEAQAEEEQICRGKYKYDYKINKNISISILKDEIVEALYDPERDLEVFCQQMKKAMKKSTVPIRPERKFTHTRKTHRKYPMNRRRAL